MATKDKELTLRLDVDLYQKCKKACEIRYGTSMNGLINIILERYLSHFIESETIINQKYKEPVHKVNTNEHVKLEQHRS